MPDTSDFANPPIVELVIGAQSIGAAGLVSYERDETPDQGWSPLIDELLRIRNLQDGWDGEGAEAPSKPLVDRAVSLALHLQANACPPADRVVAGVNGTVSLEWHAPLGYLEIEVTSPLDAEYRLVRKGADRAAVVHVSFRVVLLTQH